MQMRRGLTLIEAVIAILVFAIGGLGLAASAATIIRQMSANTLRANAGFIARSTSETANGFNCDDLAGGETRSNGIRSVWTLNGATTKNLDQRVERTDHRGTHNDRFLSAVSCD
ncbi:MAG: prepilin-type N-terminal cleavage/methylation domain-containing protein [Gemmatimonadota bacterium]|nr:prepilin-type N-terminal cleavage/methylation domain-containing protein [Gemmatimonadota bacterium]